MLNQSKGNLRIKPIKVQFNKTIRVLREMNPFLTITYESQNVKTAVCYGQNKNPVFEELFEFILGQSNFVKIELWDKHAVFPDELIAETIIDIRSVYVTRVCDSHAIVYNKDNDMGVFFYHTQFTPSQNEYVNQQTYEQPIIQTNETKFQPNAKPTLFDKKPKPHNDDYIGNFPQKNEFKMNEKLQNKNEPFSSQTTPQSHQTFSGNQPNTPIDQYKKAHSLPSDFEFSGTDTKIHLNNLNPGNNDKFSSQAENPDDLKDFNTTNNQTFSSQIENPNRKAQNPEPYYFYPDL